MTDLSAEDFRGTWRIERRIDDHLTRSTGRFAGTAEIVEAEPDWLYRESGHLELATGGSFQAERSYLWRPVQGGFDVSFSDGRAFHTVRFGAPAAGHWCDPDQYEVLYGFGQWPVWTAIWRVTGPRKDYVMTSKYSR